MSYHTQAISPSDFDEAKRIFTEAGLPHDRIRFRFKEETDQWCLHDVLDDSVIATRAPAPDAIDWTKT